MRQKLSRSYSSAMSASLRPSRSSASATTTSNCFPLGVGDHLLILRPEPAGAAHRAVAVHFRDRPALAFNIPPANLDLIVDRFLPLQLARIAGIDDRTHYPKPLLPIADRSQSV
jgi:hypothetical protein